MLRSSRNKFTRGFTLVEMLVSVAIVSVIMTIVVVNESHYSDTTVLNNTIADISVALRSAQVYGISVKEAGVGTGNFSAGYGVDFDTSTDGKSGYIFFVDRLTPNFIYDSGTSCPTGNTSECLEKKSFNSGIVVSKICMIDTNGAKDCSPGRVDITFVRPQSDAHITFLTPSGTQIDSSNIQGADITLTSPTGSSRSVKVYVTGQISLP